MHKRLLLPFFASFTQTSSSLEAHTYPCCISYLVGAMALFLFYLLIISISHERFPMAPHFCFSLSNEPTLIHMHKLLNAVILPYFCSSTFERYTDLSSHVTATVTIVFCIMGLVDYTTIFFMWSRESCIIEVPL